MPKTPRRLTEKQARAIADTAELTKAPDWATNREWQAVAADGTPLVTVTPSYNGTTRSGRNGWAYRITATGTTGHSGPYKTRQDAAVQGLMAWMRWATAR
jgi:hypothetical protein